jgi:sRNA-binding regulator protein Hfq
MDTPHWKIDRTKLLSVFDIVHAFPASRPKSTSFEKHGEALRFVASDKDYYLETSFPLTNLENQEQSMEVIYFNFVQLKYLVNSVDDFALVVREGRIIFVAEGFQVKVETWTFNSQVSKVPPPVKLPTKEFFPSYLIETMGFIFSQTANATENIILVNGNKVSAVFTEFSGQVELLQQTVPDKDTPDMVKLTPPMDLGRMFLRRTDIPVLRALNSFSKGQVKFVFNKTDKRFWAHYDGTWTSFLVIPERDPTKSIEDRALEGVSDAPEISLLTNKTLTALKTMSFLGQENIQFQSKNGVIVAFNPQAQFMVGKGALEDFSTGVKRLERFFNTIPQQAIPTVSYKKLKSALYLTFEHSDTKVHFVVRNDLSQVKASNKPMEVFRTNSAMSGAGEGLKSLEAKA